MKKRRKSIPILCYQRIILCQDDLSTLDWASFASKICQQCRTKQSVHSKVIPCSRQLSSSTCTQNSNAFNTSDCELLLTCLWSLWEQKELFCKGSHSLLCWRIQRKIRGMCYKDSLAGRWEKESVSHISCSVRRPLSEYVESSCFLQQKVFSEDYNYNYRETTNCSLSFHLFFCLHL